jgi:putative SOS response-associated peptidase YedK
MNRLHKPGPKRAPHLQDKRSVVPIAPEDVDEWLFAPQECAAALIRLAPAETFDAAPATPVSPAASVSPGIDFPHDLGT